MLQLNLRLCSVRIGSIIPPDLAALMAICNSPSLGYEITKNRFLQVTTLNELEQLLATASEAISTCDGLKDIEALRVQYLGKKGLVTEQLKGLGKLSAEQRPCLLYTSDAADE